MNKDTIHISFSNRHKPKAGFDMIPLDEPLKRTDLDHSPFQFHLVEFYIILFIEAGEGYHTIDFTKHSYQQGTILTIRKDQIHHFHQNNTAKGLLLLFTEEFLLSYFSHLESLRTIQLFNEILSSPKIQLSKEELIEISELIQRINHEYYKIHDKYSLAIIRSELHILISKLFRIKSNTNTISSNTKYLNEFIEFQNLIEKNATKHSKVKDYAKMLGVSSKTLNNITRSIVHKSAKEFIDDICTKQIKRLLINTELSIKEVAYQSGFEESSNFYKYFKRQTQVTPEQFRSNF